MAENRAENEIKTANPGTKKKKKKRISKKVRVFLILFAVLLVLVSAILCVFRLMKIQVVNSGAYSRHETVTTAYNQKIPATRGEIVDAAGTTLIGNYVCYAVVIDEKSFPSSNSESNAILLRLTEILSRSGNEWQDTLPITPDMPYDFAEDAEESKLSAMKRKIGVND